MIQPTIKRKRDRADRTTKTPVRIVSAIKAAAVLTVTFDQPVILKGVPQYTTDAPGADPLSAVMTSPSVMVLTFDATIAAATEFNIPFEDPAVRSAAGGFVANSTFPLV